MATASTEGRSFPPSSRLPCARCQTAATDASRQTPRDRARWCKTCSCSRRPSCHRCRLRHGPFDRNHGAAS
eukprot:859798-Pleurochrysis_carterae.AAC.1